MLTHYIFIHENRCDMVRKSLLAISSSFGILIIIFMILIVDWRSPKDIISKSFMIPVAASDMRCAMYLNDEYKLVDTKNYDPAPFLMSFLQPIRETEVFTKREHIVEVVAWPSSNPRGQLEDAYCKVHLQGRINNQEEYLFQESVGARISFDKHGEVVVTEHDEENAEIEIKRNDDGSIRYINVIQSYPISY